MGAIVADCPARVERINQKNDGQQGMDMPAGALSAVFRILRETPMSSCVHRLAVSCVMRWTHMHAYRTAGALRYNRALPAAGPQLRSRSPIHHNAKLLASGSTLPLNDY